MRDMPLVSQTLAALETPAASEAGVQHGLVDAVGSKNLPHRVTESVQFISVQYIHDP